jgi:hypothetical protein
MTIKSKIHNYGNEKESTWPSQFGTGEKGVFHIEDGECKEGYPEPKFERFGTPPMVIFDSMPATYHEAAGRVIESRKEWELTDKQLGTITFSSKEAGKPKIDEANERKKKKQELRKASFEALKAYQQNPEFVKQKVAKQAEIQREVAEKTGIDKLIKDV